MALPSDAIAICVLFYPHDVAVQRLVRRGTVFLAIDSAEVAATPERYVYGYWEGLPTTMLKASTKNSPKASRRI